jgi:hypothetical protein
LGFFLVSLDVRRATTPLGFDVEVDVEVEVEVEGEAEIDVEK